MPDKITILNIFLIQLVSSDSVGSPGSISVFENKLYWSNFEANEISECDKFTGKNKRSLVRIPFHKSTIYGVHVQHPSLHGKDVRKFSTIFKKKA